MQFGVITIRKLSKLDKHLSSSVETESPNLVSYIYHSVYTLLCLSSSQIERYRER